MNYKNFLKNGLAGLCLAGCSMAAQATVLDIDQLSGFLFIPTLNSTVAAVDTQIDSRNHMSGPSSFANEPGFSTLSTTFNNVLTSADGHYTGGSFGWTVFNRGSTALGGIRFSVLLDAALANGIANVATTGGGAAGHYSEFGSFDNNIVGITSRLIQGTTPPNSLIILNPDATTAANESMLYALGLDIGSLQIDQGFQIIYRFGNTGLFGKNGDNKFHLDVDAPRFIPEPGSLAMIALGMMGWVTTRRLCKRNKAHPASAV